MFRVLIEITDDSSPKERQAGVQVEFRSQGSATDYNLGIMLGNAVEGVKHYLEWADDRTLMDGLLEELTEQFTNRSQDQ